MWCMRCVPVYICVCVHACMCLRACVLVCVCARVYACVWCFPSSQVVVNKVVHGVWFTLYINNICDYSG